jgi:hypothetical protein
MDLIKRILLILIVCISYSTAVRSQTTAPGNKAIAEIFTDLHVNLNDTSNTTGFGVNRAYLGYNFVAENNFSARLIVNLGSPDDVITGNVRRRYAYFREASIIWSNQKLRMAFGLTDTRIFKYQQNFWGKRYLANTYQALNGYGYVADLGLSLDYKFNEIFSGDITVMNGEGYLELQMDNGIKSSAGLTITPTEILAFRIYGDYEQRPGPEQFTGIFFAGLKAQNINVGIEASMKTNLDGTSGHHAWGISGTGGINFTKKDEVFLRFDYSTSVIPEGENLHWNEVRDGTFSIFGLQHTFTPNIKLALNFQGRNPHDSTLQNSKLIYLNALFKF